MISVDSGLLAVIVCLAFLAFVLWILADAFAGKP